MVESFILMLGLTLKGLYEIEKRNKVGWMLLAIIYMFYFYMTRIH